MACNCGGAKKAAGARLTAGATKGSRGSALSPRGDGPANPHGSYYWNGPAGAKKS